MNKTLKEARFKTSMLDLQAGDAIGISRGSRALFSAVLKRRVERGEVYLTLSQFSPELISQQYPKEVCWDASLEMMLDTGGRIFFLPEEWESTEKEGAKLFLSRVRASRATFEDKKKAIFESMKDRKRTFSVSASDILKEMGQQSPPLDAVNLLSFALFCAAERVWDVDEV
jgi:hypothetical protein